MRKQGVCGIVFFHTFAAVFFKTVRRTKIYIVFVILLLSVQDFKAQQRISDSLSVYFEVGRSEVLRGESAVDTAYYIYSRYASNPGFYMKITGYASPDGASDFNSWLAGQRMREVVRGLETRLGGLLVLDSVAAGVDWNGLAVLVERGPAFEGSQQVLETVRQTPLYVFADGGIAGGRKKALMDLRGGRVYRYMMDNIFPQLRRVSINIGYTDYEPLAGAGAMICPVSSGALRPEPHTDGGIYSGEQSEPLYRMALKTNLLADVALMPSLEAEYLINRRWSVAVHGAVAWWSRPSVHNYYQLATIYPEGRWWFRTKSPWHGHYLGLFAGGTWYDLEHGGRGYKGEGGFVGLSYGYMFPVSKSLSIEAGVGLGYLYTRYEEYLPVPYQNGTHYVYQQTSQMNYFGPLKLKLALVWRLWDVNKKGGRL